MITAGNLVLYSIIFVKLIDLIFRAVLCLLRIEKIEEDADIYPPLPPGHCFLYS